jgi:hypothetical protein
MAEGKEIHNLALLFASSVLLLNYYDRNLEY